MRATIRSVLVSLWCLAGVQDLAAQNVSIFGGGPLYHQTATVFPQLKASGFDTVLFWSVHIYANGDLVLNGDRIVAGGQYVGRPGWPAEIATLKVAPTSIDRIEFSVGSAGVRDFENIEALIQAQGTGPTSILYRNFAALLAAIPDIDAIDYDDESNYDVASTVAFSNMLVGLGYQLTFVPYTARSFWRAVHTQVEAAHPGAIDRVYLQCYAGGSRNDPASWNGDYPGLRVSPGLWVRHGSGCRLGDTPSSVGSRIGAWASQPGIDGGFLWLLDDVLACESQYPMASYATAMQAALGYGRTWSYGAGCGRGQVWCSTPRPGAPLTALLEAADPQGPAVLLLSSAFGQQALPAALAPGCFAAVPIGTPLPVVSIPTTTDGVGRAQLILQPPAGFAATVYLQYAFPQAGLNPLGFGTTAGVGVSYR